MFSRDSLPARWIRAFAVISVLIAIPAQGVADDLPRSETQSSTAPSSEVASTSPDDEREPAEPEVLFEQLLVVGTSEQARRVPGSAHVITREDLERQAYADVHRVLRQTPGVNIQEEDGYGLRPNIGIRGTGVERSQKVTLLEDGVLIAPAPYSAPSAYYSPTAARMEGFEIRKGSGAIRQGPHTNGGAINYISTSIPGELRGRLDLAGGTEGQQRARGWIGDSTDRFGWLLDTYRFETAGFKRLDGGGETGFDLEDYVGKFRVNSRPGSRVFQALELKLASAEQSGDETYLGLSQDDFDRNPYRRYAASAGDRIVSDHEQLQVSYHVDPGARWRLTTTLYRNEFFRNWYKLEKVDGVPVADILRGSGEPRDRLDLLEILRGEVDSAPGALAVRNNRRDYYSEGAQVLVGLKPVGPGGHSLDLGLRFHQDQEDRFQEEDLLQMLGGARVLSEAGAPGSESNRIADARAVAFFAQSNLSFGRWTLTPGLRVESIELMRRDFGRADPARIGLDLASRSNDLTEVIPGLGVGFELGKWSNLVFGVHRGFSPPSPSSTEGVDAEESVNYELGWRYRRTGRSAELIAFFNDYDNLLGNDTVSTGGGGTGDQFNGGEVEVRGLEAGLSLDLAGSRSRVRLPLRLAYTYTEAEFGTSFATDFADWAPRVERGDELPYLAANQLYAGLSAEGQRWALHLDTSHTSEMRTSAGRGPIQPADRIGSRFLVDLKAEVRLARSLKAWGQVLNVTDRVYVAARRPAGLRPGRPRAALLGLTLDLTGAGS